MTCIKRILTLGDSWTAGIDSSDPATMSWPAQMARNYNVEVVNLAQQGSSNQRQMRIGIEELCQDSNFDLVIFGAVAANRVEVNDQGKWQQAWPNIANMRPSHLDKFFFDIWTPWGDFQNYIMMSFYFIHSLQALGIPLYMTGLSLRPNHYVNELHWITNYQGNGDFDSLGMSVTELNGGVDGLDQKLKALKSIHMQNLKSQPDYFYPVIENYLKDPQIGEKFNYIPDDFDGHPNDQGYHALSEYFAKKIGLA